MSLEEAKKELLIRASEECIANARDFGILKNKVSKETKTKLIHNFGLVDVYRELVGDKKIKESKVLEKLLQKAKIRSLSGVSVITVLTRPFGCPSNCTYCPNEPGMPKSYLSNEPAVMRAILGEFDPYRQIMIRLEALEKQGHSTDKIELIVIGGTFSSLPEWYQYWYIKECFRACNEFGREITNHKSQINLKYQKLRKNYKQSRRRMKRRKRGLLG